MKKEKYFRHYAVIEPGEDIHYYHNEGGVCGGELVGIIIMGAHLPNPPGHICNAYTFDFPVRYLKAQNTNQQKVHSGNRSILDDVIEAAQQLERDGCRVICSSCGYFGNFQKEIAASVSIPVYMSSVIQVPWIARGLAPDQKIGIICGDAPHLTYSLFESCGVSKEDFDRCVIIGAQDEPEFSKFDKNIGEFHSGLVRDEIVGLAKKLQEENPDLGAILLECTDMPPYAADVQAATNLPVFDVNGMVEYLYRAVTQKRYRGYV